MKKLRLLSILLLIAIFSFSSNEILIKGTPENSENYYLQNNKMTVVLNVTTGNIDTIRTNSSNNNLLNSHSLVIQNNNFEKVEFIDSENGFNVIEKSKNFELTNNYKLIDNTLYIDSEIKNISDKDQLLKMNELIDYEGLSYNYVSKSFFNNNLFSIQVENSSLIYGSFEGDIKRMITNGNRIFSSPGFKKLKPSETISFKRFFEVGDTVSELHKDFMDKEGIKYKTYSGKINIKNSNDSEFIDILLKQKFFEDILTKTYTDKNGNYTLYYPEAENLYIEFSNKNFSNEQYYNLSSEIDLKSQKNDFYYLPALTNVKTDGITFNYRTLIPSKSIVHIFKEGKNVLNIKNNYPKEYHHLKAYGLEPDTEYYYYVELPESYGSDRKLSNIRTFRTEPDKFKPFDFVVYGDSQIYNDRHKLVVDTIYKNQGYPSFIARVGDQVEKGHEDYMWADQFKASYQLTGSVPVYTALGNHEYNDDLYYKALDLPDGGGDDNERFYSFDYLNVHFIFLDSNIIETSPLFDEQLKWLENDLKKVDSNKFIFVSFHHPFWTQAQEYGPMVENRPEGHSNTKYWLPLFVKYGVDAVFNGHIHSYERYYKDGIQFITTAGGGSKLNELHTAEPLPWNKFELLRNLNYVNVDVNQNKAIFTVYSVAYAPSKDTPEIYYPTNEIVEQFEVTK